MSKRTSETLAEFNNKSKKRKSDCVVLDLIDFLPFNNHLRQKFNDTQRSTLLWSHNLKALKGRYYLPIEFRNEKSFIVELFQSCGYLYYGFMELVSLISKEMANDKDVIINAMKICRENIEFASEELKNDIEFFYEIRDCFRFQASDSDYYLRTYFSQKVQQALTPKDLQANVSINEYEFLKFVPREFMNEKTKILNLLKACKENKCKFLTRDQIMQSLNEKLLNDKDFILESTLIFGDAQSLKYASLELQQNREFLKNVFIQSNSIDCISDELKNDKKFIIEILKGCREFSSVFKNLPSELKNDREVVLEGVRTQYFAFDHISEQFMNDRQIILACLKNNNGGVALERVSEELLQDREIILAAVKNRAYNLRFVPSHLCDKEIILEALREHDYVFDYMPIEYNNDSDIFLEFLKCHTYISSDGDHDEEVSSLQDKIRYWSLTIDKELMTNRDFIIKALDYCNIIPYIPQSDLNHDREFILRIIKETKVGERGILLASHELLEDRSFLLKSIRENGLVLKWLPKHLRRDPEIEEEAVKQAGIVLNIDRKDELYAIRMRTCYPGL